MKWQVHERHNMKMYRSAPGFRHLIIFALATTLLNGCGGGGGSPGATGGSTAGASGSGPVALGTASAGLTLTVANGTPNQVTIFSAANPAILTAKFIDAKGAPVSGATVRFTPNLPALVQFSPTAGQGLTGSDGTFTVRVLPGNTVSSGPVSVTADVASNGSTVSSNTVQLYVTQG